MDRHGETGEHLLKIRSIKNEVNLFKIPSQVGQAQAVINSKCDIQSDRERTGIWFVILYLQFPLFFGMHWGASSPPIRCDKRLYYIHNKTSESPVNYVPLFHCQLTISKLYIPWLSKRSYSNTRHRTLT
jgi:hypothetical protein